MKLSSIARFVLVLSLVVVLVPAGVAAQQDQKKKKKKKKVAADSAVVEVVAMFENNELDELVAAVEAASANGAVVNGDAVFMEGLALEKLNRKAAASAAYSSLAERPETDGWHWVGASAAALVAGDNNNALEAANRATEMEPANSYAHYQRGLVLVKRGEYGPASEAFTRMLEIDGDFAYGHYYAGMSFHQARNLMAAGNHLRRFLELAPGAPEKLAVQGILATISG